MQTLESILAVVANVMTILGIGGLLTFGIFTKDINLLGRKVFKFVVFTFRFAVILFLLVASYLFFNIPYGFVLLLLKNSMQSFYWEAGREWEHIVAYLVGALITLVPFFLLILVTATSSLYYPKLFWNKVFGGRFALDVSTYGKFAQLQIIEATYGSKSHTVDVAHTLQSLVDSGKLRVLASNQLAGDPHYGVVKTLVVKYKLDDEEHETQVREDDYLQIP